MTRPLGLHERRDRTEAVLAALRDTPFAWKGRANCIHLARAQLVAMGHRPGPVPRFATALGAKRALEQRGFARIGDVFDAMPGLVRIAPAAAWIGDLMLLPGEGAFDAVTVAVGGGMVVGWHGEDLSRMHPIAIGAGDAIAAWRL